jgi:putative ABC transport system substrate-binding protein
MRSSAFPLLLSVLLVLAARISLSAEDPAVTVVVSGSGAPYEETLTGLRRHLQAKGLKADLTVHQLGGDAAKAAQVAKDVKRQAPRLIVTVGALATENVLRENPDIPVVAAMILKADAVLKAPNATAVVLQIPAGTQFQWVRKVLPKAGVIGVVFNPAENQEKVDIAARVAGKAGLRIEAEPVRSPADIPAALDRLAKKVDALWGIADAMVLTPQTAKSILLFSFRNKIPFIGPSSAWVKAGALYSLDWDYTDMGEQCGEAVARILQGARAAAIPIGMPRKISLSVNRRTADDLSLSLAESVISEAKTVY